jgi:chromosomal replication initiation ATPase DnaA
MAAKVLAGKRITSELCEILAAEYWALKISDLKNGKRNQEIVQARISFTFIMKAQGKTDREISQKLKVTRSAVSYYKATLCTDNFTKKNIESFISWCNGRHKLKLPESDIWIKENS